jgi:Flp pilus assembly protein CpaB
MTREAGTSQPAGRDDRRRLSASHVLVALAVVLAFVLNILALQDRSASVLVAIADRSIVPGEAFRSDMVRLTPVSSDFEGLSSLVTEDSLESFSGWVAQRAMVEGDLIGKSSLAQPAASRGRRSMSVPIEISRAAGGTVVAGDRVDVIAVRDGVASFIVSDVEVLAVPVVDGTALTARDHFLVLAVDADEALALAEAMAAGAVDVVRSTGAHRPEQEGDAGT